MPLAGGGRDGTVRAEPVPPAVLLKDGLLKNVLLENWRACRI